MFRDILASRSILVGIVFFLLVVGSSLLYHWHVRRTTDGELAPSEALLQHLENRNEARTAADTVEARPVDFKHAETPLETEDTQHIDEATEAFTEDDLSVANDMLDMFEDEFLPVDVESLLDKVNENVPVSPNGFGPLPAVPPDYPNQNVWSQARLARITPEHELLSRVRIELWNQGVRTQGAVYRTDFGRIYPTTDDVVYIQWDDTPAADGEMYVTEMLGSPSTIDQYEEDIYRGIFPSHLTIYEFPDGGIDPYAFLGL